MDKNQVTENALLNLERAIHFKKRYILSLYKRLCLIRKDYVLKSEYEKNEIEITELQTKSIIIRTICKVSQMEEEFSSKINSIVPCEHKNRSIFFSGGSEYQTKCDDCGEVFGTW